MSTSLRPGARQLHASHVGDNTGFWMLDCRITVLASAENTADQMGVLHIEAPPGHEPPLHVHRDEDEAYFMLDGRMIVRCGDHELESEPGTYVFLPRGVAHGIRVTGDVPARFLMIVAPGGFEAFFCDQGTPPAGPGLPTDPPPPELELIGRMFARHHVQPVH